MSRRLRDTVAVVTGASSGIGRATALALADRGAAVVVTARREEALAGVVQECRDRGAEAMALPADVTDHVAVEGVAGQAVGRYGRLDIWVNNAAVNVYGRLEEAPVDTWHRVVETNVFGTYHGLRAALPWMHEQGSGVLVNVSSVVGKVGSPYQSAYVASKHAIRALSDCVRQELFDAPGIAVSTVLPGPVDTPLFENAGNYTGQEIRPIKPVIPADRVAATIVSCAARPRREAIVGGSTMQILGFNRLLPGLTERVMARQVDRDHFGDSPAHPEPGNVRKPTAGNGSVSGGWTRSSKKLPPDDPRAASNDRTGSRVAKLAVLGAAAAAVVGVVARGRR